LAGKAFAVKDDVKICENCLSLKKSTSGSNAANEGYKTVSQDANKNQGQMASQIPPVRTDSKTALTSSDPQSQAHSKPVESHKSDAIMGDPPHDFNQATPQKTPVHRPEASIPQASSSAPPPPLPPVPTPSQQSQVPKEVSTAMPNSLLAEIRSAGGIGSLRKIAEEEKRDASTAAFLRKDEGNSLTSSSSSLSIQAAISNPGNGGGDMLGELRARLDMQRSRSAMDSFAAKQESDDEW